MLSVYRSPSIGRTLESNAAGTLGMSSEVYFHFEHPKQSYMSTGATQVLGCVFCLCGKCGQPAIVDCSVAETICTT